MSLRTLYDKGISPSAPTEQFMRVGGIRTDRQTEHRGILFVHGSGGTALQVAGDPYQKALIDGVSLGLNRATIVSADWGFETYGNDLAMSRLDDGYTYLRSRGADVRIGLIGGSMGSCNILNWAYRNPGKVAFVAATIPLVDLADIYARYAPAKTGMDAAYGGTYNDATMGAMHSPIKFATKMNPDLPITLYTASDDAICVPATATAFIAARPQTKRVNVGALGHTPLAMYTALSAVLSQAKAYYG